MGFLSRMKWVTLRNIKHTMVSKRAEFQVLSFDGAHSRRMPRTMARLNQFLTLNLLARRNRYRRFKSREPCPGKSHRSFDIFETERTRVWNFSRLSYVWNDGISFHDCSMVFLSLRDGQISISSELKHTYLPLQSKFIYK